MGCTSSKNSDSSVKSMRRLQENVKSAMTISTEMIPLGLKLNGMMTHDAEVDAPLQDPAKLRSYPDFFTRLGADIAKVDKSEAIEFQKNGPGSVTTAEQKANLTKFIEAVKTIGSTCSPPDAKWMKVCQTLVEKKTDNEEALKVSLAIDINLQREMKSIEEANPPPELIRQEVAESKKALQNIEMGLKNTITILNLRIEAGKAGEIPMGQLKMLTGMAAEIEAANVA